MLDPGNMDASRGLHRIAQAFYELKKEKEEKEGKQPEKEPEKPKVVPK